MGCGTTCQGVRRAWAGLHIWGCAVAAARGAPGGRGLGRGRGRAPRAPAARAQPERAALPPPRLVPLPRRARNAPSLG